MASLCTPLPTLGCRACRRPHTPRGRCGSTPSSCRICTDYSLPVSPAHCETFPTSSTYPQPQQHCAQIGTAESPTTKPTDVSPPPGSISRMKINSLPLPAANHRYRLHRPAGHHIDVPGFVEGASATSSCGKNRSRLRSSTGQVKIIIIGSDVETVGIRGP
jgi:hypothetical protein